MKFKIINVLTFCLLSFYWCSCKQQVSSRNNIRPLADTIGFAQYNWQMDSIINRIGRLQTDLLNDASPENISTASIKAAISPHDDYSYVGFLYPAVFKNIKASTIFLFGVAHKALNFNIENQIIFDNYDYWRGPYGAVKVSSFRNKLMAELPSDMYEVNDSIHKQEHSLEGLIPFLQYFNRDIEIVPILIPYISFDKLDWVGRALSNAIYSVVQENNYEWGNDFAFVISNDAVHYGDEDWGGKNFAWFGSDSLGYQKAIQHDYEIVESISGIVDLKAVSKFYNFTVQDTNFHEYKWTWCGRYSVPAGLLTAYYLNKIYGDPPLKGIRIGYSTSIGQNHIPVEDLLMGVTAPANIRHWVGYSAIIYE